MRTNYVRKLPGRFFWFLLSFKTFETIGQFSSYNKSTTANTQDNNTHYSQNYIWI